MLLLVSLATTARASKSVTLTWDRNPEPDVSGYVIHYGTAPRSYLQRTNVGNVTLATVRGLEETRPYYFALTAVNTSGLESEFSNEATDVQEPWVHLEVREATNLAGPWTAFWSTNMPKEHTAAYYRTVVIVPEPPPVEPSNHPPALDLAMWLRADAGLDGTPGIGLWRDQSTNGIDASQSLLASQPTLLTNALNGKPVVQFDGVNDFMTFNLPVNGLANLTLCLVSANSADRTGGSTEAGDAALFWNETQSWGTLYLSPFQSRVQMRFGTTQVANQPTYVRPTTIGSGYSLTTMIKSNATESLYVNGVEVLHEQGKQPAVAGCQNTGNLGRGYNNDTYFPGAIAELLIYRRALSHAERQQLEWYLLNKYFGLTNAVQGVSDLPPPPP